MGGVSEWLGERCRDSVGQETEQHSENVTESRQTVASLVSIRNFFPSELESTLPQV